MSEKPIRTPLGSVDTNTASPYDLAVVITEYIRSTNNDGVANVATLLQRWHEATTRQAAPKLHAQLERSKTLLQKVASGITDELHSMERWQASEAERKGNESKR